MVSAGVIVARPRFFLPRPERPVRPIVFHDSMIGQSVSRRDIVVTGRYPLIEANTLEGCRIFFGKGARKAYLIGNLFIAPD